MTHTETLRLALEALENLGNHDHVCPQWPTYAEPENYPKCNCGYDEAITAIKAALEAKDEPVAYVETKEVHGQMCSFIYRADSTKLLPDGTKLYIAPPQRKPLTEQQIKEALADMSALQMPLNKLIPAIARAIEVAHGIK